MKRTRFALLLFGMFLGTACRKDCPEPINPSCSEGPPQGELCQAAFQRWFYQKESNRCVQISYNGCSFRGFETREACEECLCKNR
ncbi:MAG: BPTI/Kunitz domain-containing protein [Bacteroidota bacterium]